MNCSGFLLALAAFGIIGIWHPIVIYGEYYIGQRACTGLFTVMGALFVMASFFINDDLVCCLTALWGCCSVWGIKEVAEQVRRVDRGWFPEGKGHAKTFKKCGEAKVKQEA